MMNWFEAAVPNQVNSLNYFLEAARGRITGHEIVIVKGWNSSIGTSPETIGVRSTSVRNYQSSATTVQISSSSANDTAAGTGARTLTLKGLNGSLDEVSETITLNGQTVVDSVNSYLYINSLKVLTTGSGLQAAGNIFVSKNGATVTSGTPDTATDVLEEIIVGMNTSQALVYTIKKNYTGFLLSANIFGGITAASSYFEINRRINSTGILIQELALSIGTAPNMVFNLGGIPLITLNEGDTIDARAYNSVSCSFGGVLGLVLIKTT